MNLLHRKAFTLVELLVAMAITAAILGMLLQMIGSSSSQWKSTRENAEAYQSARVAFDVLTRTLSQATLNIEYDYYDAARRPRLSLAAISDEAERRAQVEAFKPDIYGRYSGLHFVSGKMLVKHQQTHAIFFQAPLDFDSNFREGSDSGQLNAVGYFVRYGDDSANRPANVSGLPPEPRERFRLMQYLQPTELLGAYHDATGQSWFKTDVDPDPPLNAHVLAENVVVLAILPKLPDEQMQPADAIAKDYEYDSRVAWPSGSQPQPPQMHQMPPVVRVLMVAIDEASAMRNPTLGSEFSNLFQTPAKFGQDLAQVENALKDARANYRVFQTDVPIRSAKWSL